MSTAFGFQSRGIAPANSNRSVVAPALEGYTPPIAKKSQPIIVANECYIRPGTTGVIFMGTTGTGKTNGLRETLMKTLPVWKKNGIDYDIICFCLDPRSNSDYKWIDSRKRYDYSEKVIDPSTGKPAAKGDVIVNVVMESQLERKAEVNERIEQGQDAKHKYIIMIFDDFVGQVNTHTNDVLKRLSCTARHAHIIPIWLVQKFTGLGPSMRINAELILATHFVSDDEVEGWRKLTGPNAYRAKSLLKVAMNKTFVVWDKADSETFKYVKFPYYNEKGVRVMPT